MFKTDLTSKQCVGAPHSGSCWNLPRWAVQTVGHREMRYACDRHLHNAVPREDAAASVMAVEQI